ncbi:DUF1304 family protein [Rothia kristinae]|nr:DUF1304 family protein [Rothia kristinae]
MRLTLSSRDGCARIEPGRPGPSTVRSPEEAAATRDLAFNQGFYNLFLTVLAAAGAICWFAGASTVGLTLGIAGLGSMLEAALVLFCSSPAQRGAAVKQGILPLLALLSLAVGSLLG